MATMISLAYVHIYCYPIVDDLWGCYGAFRKNVPLSGQPSGQPLDDLLGVVTWGLLIMWVWIPCTR